MEDKINQIILYKYKVISERADMAFTVKGRKMKMTTLYSSGVAVVGLRHKPRTLKRKNIIIQNINNNNKMYSTLLLQPSNFLKGFFFVLAEGWMAKPKFKDI